MSTGTSLFRLVERLERWPALDLPVRALTAAGDALVRPGTVKDTLSGTWLGHSLHPLLTDFPLGAWMSASLLDLVGGRSTRPASRRLVGFGVLAALPVAASGLSDWLDSDQEERRVGVVHAAINSSALAIYTASFLARRRGRHARGVFLGLAGGLTATAGGYLGGHLSLARGVGVNNTAFEDGPTEWTAVAGEAPVDRSTATATVDGVELLLAVDGADLVALSDRCSHRGGPLHEGPVAQGCVTCPWHGSRFRLADGAVAAGPATVPQPSYETRLGADGLEARRRPLDRPSYPSAEEPAMDTAPRAAPPSR